MFNGRHCSISDYELLVRETESYLATLKRKDNDAFSIYLDRFIDLVNQFDSSIGESLKRKILVHKEKEEFEIVERIVKESLEPLKRNVLVDIQEHA